MSGTIDYSSVNTVNLTVEDYNKTVQDYLAFTAKIDYRAPQKTAEAIIKLLDGRKDANILDAGCGTGYVGQQLKEQGLKWTELVGVDASKGMLEEARVLGVYDQLRCQYVDGDRNKVRCEDATFDITCTCGALGYMMLPHAILPELVRCTKPGGYIVNVFRKSSLEDKDKNGDDLIPIMTKLEEEGKWKLVYSIDCPEYRSDVLGVTFVHQVC